MIQRWHCPTAEKWDKYLLYVAGKEQIELKKHLAECPHCRLYVNERKKELEELQQVWDVSAVSDIIYLHPAESEISPTDSIKTLLAAKGNDKSVGTESITLTSRDHKVLFRAVRDFHSGEIWLYLIADKQELFQNVLVKPFGTDKEYVTDDCGRVNLGKIDWPKEDRLTAEVHLPKASFKMEPLKESIEAGEVVELNSTVGDKIKACFTGEGRNRRLSLQLIEIRKELRDIPIKIAVRSRDKTRICGIETEISLEDLNNSEILEIFLYQ